MNTIVKSSHGIALIPVESRLLSERKLFIEGEITAVSACDFVKSIMLLVKEDSEKPIDIYINSLGGEVNAGLLIYDTLKGLKAEINLYCIGMCASMAAIILSSGKKGHRFILKHSQTMIHEPLISGGVGGSATTIKRTAESILDVRQKTIELLMGNTGRRKGEIEEAISYDNYMDAEESVAFGICDHIKDSII